MKNKLLEQLTEEELDALDALEFVCGTFLNSDDLNKPHYKSLWLKEGITVARKPSLWQRLLQFLF